MNRTGCPENSATDKILLVDNHDLACDLNISAWIAMGAFICTMKLIIALGHTILFRIRQKNITKRIRKRSSRFPFIPVLSWILCFDYVVFFVLSCTVDQTHYTPLLFGFGWTVWSLVALFHTYKFISLGHRIAFGNKTPSLAGRGIEGEALSKLNLFGKIILVQLLIAVMGIFLSFCIFTYVFPDKYTPIQVANGFCGGFCINMMILIMHHFERIIAVVKQSRDENPGNLSTTHEMTVALKKLREQEIATFIPLATASIFYIVVLAVPVLMNYYNVVIVMFVETFGSLSIMFSNFKAMLWRRNIIENVLSERHSKSSTHPGPEIFHGVLKQNNEVANNLKITEEIVQHNAE